LLPSIGLLLLSSLILSSCNTVPERALSSSDLSTMRLAGISITVAPDAIKSWPDGDGQTGPNGNPVPVRFLTQAEGAKRLDAKIRTAMASKLGGVLSGSRPVRAVVTVREFEIVPKDDRMAKGGRHRLKADVVLVDAQTGKELSAYRDQEGAQSAGAGGAGIAGGLIGGGIAGALGVAAANAIAASQEISADILVEKFVGAYADWLSMKPKGQSDQQPLRT
jgi:hypothetical protein